ncbi:MAG TPA: diguanylate cyclase [Burkholderiales bacterium]|nr:diguanylate cyclase [Burkholderiales bacterium]
MKKFSFQMGPVLRLSVGLISLVIALVLTFDSVFDILPNQRKQLIQVRQQVSRAIGNQIIAFLVSGETARLPSVLDRMAEHDPDIRSVAIRRTDGYVVAASREHERYWVASEVGSLSYVAMPLFVNKSRWGEVELAFNDVTDVSIEGLFKHPSVLLVLLLSTVGFMAAYLYLRYALQYLDPSQAVPERVRRAFDTLTEAVLILDTHNRIMLANAGLQQLYPDAGNRLDGKPITKLGWLMESMSGEEVSNGYPWDIAVRTNQTVLGKRLKIALPDGSSRELLMNCSAIIDGGSVARGCLISFDDVTELSETNAKLEGALNELQLSQEKIQEQNEELKKLAHFDPLTACLNRRAFFSQAEPLFQAALTDGAEAVCIMSDIDHFKSFNDKYGHQVGDFVIQQVAKTLGRNLRTQDLLCRYGGEEFCIFLDGVTLKDGADVAERMRSSVEREAGPGVRTIDGLKINSSFGVASVRKGSKTLAEMIDQADQALYRAKKSGRNRVVAMEEFAVAEDAKESKTTA